MDTMSNNIDDINMINIEDIYITDNTRNIETFGKYAQDGNFLFGDITEKIIGPLDKSGTKSKLEFESDCMNIEMSVSIIDDDYLNVEYEQKELMEKIQENMIDDFMDIISNEKKDIISNEKKDIISNEKKDIISSEKKDIIISEKKENNIQQVPDDLFSKSGIIELKVTETKYIDTNDITCPNNPDIKTSVAIIGIHKSNQKSVTDNENDVIIDIDKLSPSNSFFDCHNTENSVNNVIACNTIHCSHNMNEIATSYMFENEDLRSNDVCPFSHNKSHKYKKENRGWFESVGIAAMSAMMLFTD